MYPKQYEISPMISKFDYMWYKFLLIVQKPIHGDTIGLLAVYCYLS